MDESIHLSAWLGCKVNQAFEMFTDQEHIMSWLPIVVGVEPREGGKYEISWADEKPIIQCKILIYVPNKYIMFEWNGPTDDSITYSSELNTQVTIYFLPMDSEERIENQFTEVHLTLNIINDPDDDDEIKSWFESSWATAFEKLIEHVNNTFQ